MQDQPQPVSTEKASTTSKLMNRLPSIIERELATTHLPTCLISEEGIGLKGESQVTSDTSVLGQSTEVDTFVKWDMQVLDLPNFNPVELININLKSDNKTEVNQYCQQLRTQMTSVDRQLQLLLRSQHGQVTAHSLQMKTTKRCMEGLIQRVEMLQDKASQAESAVFEVTREIKGLDLAKRNLTQAITFSKRLQMLVVAVEQLRSAIDRRQYSDASHLIQAVIELFRHFQLVRNIRPIFELRNTITELQTSLLVAVLEDLKSGFGQQGQLLKPALAPRLAQACVAADLAHPEGRRQIISFYSELHILDYSTSFAGDDEVSELQNVPQRLAWIKRFITAYEAGPAEVFPASWGVACKIAQAACELTARDLTHLLEGNGSSDVGLMMRIMQVGLAFEQQLDKKFPVDSPGCGPLPFSGMLSYCFEPHLQRYIDREASTIECKLASYRTLPPTPDSEAAVRVLVSSTEFLLFYQDSLSTLSKVTRGKFLLGLAKLFAKGLQTYSEQILTRLLPREDKRQLTTDEFDITCLILNTAHYCNEAAGQLAGRVEELLDSSFAEQVQFGPAQDSFLEVAGLSLKRILKSCEYRFEPGWSQLSKLNWATWSHLAPGATEYTQTLIASILEVGNLAYSSIYYPTVYRFFCDRLAEAFISRWHDTIIKINRISDVAVQQMKEDGERLLQQLFRLPVLGQENLDPPATFQRIVKRQYDSRIGKYLDLVAIKLPSVGSTTLDFQATMDSFLDQFLEYASEPQFPTFLRLMEVKSIKRNDQGPYREALQARLATLKLKPDLPKEIQSGSLNPILPNSAKAGISSKLVSRISPAISNLSLSGRQPSISDDPTIASSSPSSKPSSLAATHQRFQDNWRRFVGLAVQKETVVSATDDDDSEKKTP